MKYERKCTNCGRTDNYYAKGLCRTCYSRLRRNGTFETQYKRGIGSRPYMWSDKTKRILELYRDGMRQADIVKEVGLTRQEVSLVTKKYAKPTNAGRVRAMTVEELADFITGDMCELLCGAPLSCDGQCKQKMLDWLKEAVTDG